MIVIITVPILVIILITLSTAVFDGIYSVL